MMMDIDKLSSRIIKSGYKRYTKPLDLVCLNFNVPLMRDGIVRIVNELEE